MNIPLEIDSITGLPWPLPAVPHNEYEAGAAYVKSTSMDGVTYQWTQLVCTFSFFIDALQDLESAKAGYEISIALNKKLQILMPSIQAPSALIEIHDSIYKRTSAGLMIFPADDSYYCEVCSTDKEDYFEYLFVGRCYAAKDKSPLGTRAVLDFSIIADVAHNIVWFKEAHKKVLELNKILVDNLNKIK